VPVVEARPEFGRDGDAAAGNGAHDGAHEGAEHRGAGGDGRPAAGGRDFGQRTPEVEVEDRHPVVGRERIGGARERRWVDAVELRRAGVGGLVGGEIEA